MSQLAIIIPYYKIDFFEETIKSVAQQTDKRFILYIGNDASPDNPLPVIEKYFQKEEYKYFNYPENIGGKNLALQWERILENVQEEWFQILGDDDTISENFVEEFYKVLPDLEEKNISVLKFRHQWINEKSEIIKTFDYTYTQLGSIQFFMDKYFRKVTSSLSENIFKTEMYRKYKFEKIPLAWGADDIALLTFSGFKKFAYQRNAKVFVRISESSISGSASLDKVKNDSYNIFRERIIIKYSRYFPKSFIETLLDQHIWYGYRNQQPLKYNVAFYHLKNFEIIKFLKDLKKIHYTHRKK